MHKITKINIIGLGRAGLPLAAHIARKGIEVVGIDIDQTRCDFINTGENPIPEEVGLGDLLKKYAGKELFASSDYQKTQEGNVFIVIVPLFVDENNNPDFSIVDAVTNSIAENLKKGDSIIFETTFPPTTTDTRLKNILESKSGLIESEDFYLGYSPERIMTGFSLSRFEDFPKVIGGITELSSQIVYEIYSQFIPNLDKVSDTKTAEYIKVIEGCYRDTNIALANELYKIAGELEINFSEARELANHQFCNIHTPSTGVGGHCIPVYPNFLISSMLEKDKAPYVKLLQTSRETNEEMVHYWAEKIISRALLVENKTLNEVSILVTGITYRPGVKELYHSKNLALAKLLQEKGLNTFVYDEMYNKQEIEELGFTFGENGDIEFNCFTLELS